MAHEIGARVKLKSGGPVMTVSSAVLNDRQECTWFDAKLEMQTGRFPPDALEPAPEDDEGPPQPYFG